MECILCVCLCNTLVVHYMCCYYTIFTSVFSSTGRLCARIMSELFFWQVQHRTSVCSRRPAGSAVSRGGRKVSSRLRGIPRVGLRLSGRTPTPLSWWWTMGAAGCHPACILGLCRIAWSSAYCRINFTTSCTSGRLVALWGVTWVRRRGRSPFSSQLDLMSLNFYRLMLCRKQKVFKQIRWLPN